jgi:hypothetical protein
LIYNFQFFWTGSVEDTSAGFVAFINTIWWCLYSAGYFTATFAFLEVLDLFCPIAQQPIIKSARITIVHVELAITTELAGAPSSALR